MLSALFCFNCKSDLPMLMQAYPKYQTKLGIKSQFICFFAGKSIGLLCDFVVRQQKLGGVCKKKTATEVTVFRTPSGTRTLDPLIKSQLLYQLS